MFRMIKLIGYCAAGYVLYELWRGMSDAGRRPRAMAAGAQGGPGGGGSDLNRALNRDPGRMMNMTGTGRGTTVSSEDAASGQSVPHLVGRGVVTQ